MAAFSALTAMLAAWAAYAEVNPFLNAGLDGAGKLAALIDGRMAPGLSSDAREIYAAACLEVAPRLEARMLPAEPAARLREACPDRLEQIAAGSPVNAFLWFARARLALDAGDAEALNHGLVLSGGTAPNEYWLVARRFDLAERGAALLGEAAATQHRADMRVLAATGPGSRLLAARYVLSPAARDRIAAAVEQVPAQYQQWFLANVREFTPTGGELP